MPTHIFRPGNTWTAERTGGTICSFSTKTWGLWTKGKKDTQYPKSLSQGHHVKNFPSFPPHVAPLLSSSLLFFFNQAVWGCQVFWDEDSQPCEKLIPCGPSSLWRSSPWEHWWWLAGRWWWAEGGGMDGGMGGMNTGPPWPTEWLVQTLIHHQLWSPHLNLYSWFAPFPLHQQTLPPCLKTNTSFLPSSPPSTHSVSMAKLEPFWWGSLPDWQTVRVQNIEDLQHGQIVEWLLGDDSGSQWRRYSCCIVPQTSPAQHQPPAHPTPSHLALIMCQSTIPTDSSWAFCQGMKEMIGNNGGKTKGSTVLLSGFSQWAVSGT